MRAGLLVCLLSCSGTSAAAQALSNPVLTSGWSTFGLVLPRGAASGALKVGTLATQTDVKNTWPDGSIRFAIVTANIPSNQTYAITQTALATGSTPQAWPVVSVQFTIAGTTWTATLPRSGTDLWLSGPLVNEARSSIAPTAGGVPHPLLRVLFDVRSYAGGGTRVDVTAQTTLNVVGADR